MQPANKFEQGALLLMQKKIDAERVKLGQHLSACAMAERSQG
jgi:hypothetical protein